MGMNIENGRYRFIRMLIIFHFGLTSVDEIV